MMVRVPARGFNGLGFVGLGQDDSYDPSLDIVPDSGGGALDPGSTFVPQGPSLDQGGVVYDSETGSYVPVASTSDAGSGITASDLQALNNGPNPLDANYPTPAPQTLTPTQTAALTTLASSPTPTPSATQLGQIVTNGTSTGLTANQIASIVGAATNAGVQILRATNNTVPTLIPGTNLVYNPATGQIVPTGTTLSTALGSATFSSSGLLIGALVIGAVLLVMMKKN
jgi:hypothetical protein